MEIDPMNQRRRFRKREALIPRKRTCRFCAEKKPAMLDYKDTLRLQKFLTERGKIIPSRISGNCARHQRQLMREIKKARAIALLPYVAE